MTATASVGYSNSLHTDHRTKLVHLIDSPCSSSSLSYMDAAPHRQNDVICLSSPSETSDNEDHDHTYTGSASSVDGSSRPGSDRFLLGGDFSSCDSDAFVSATSGSSDDGYNHSQPLSELKDLFEHGIKRKRSSLPVIVVSDSSDSDSSTHISISSSSTMLPSELQNSLIVSFPLNSLKVPPQNTNRLGKRPPAKLALSHFATTKKKLRIDSSGDEHFSETSQGLRSPLSLKLKKSSSSNRWHSVILANSLTSPPSIKNDVVLSNSQDTSNDIVEPSSTIEKHNEGVYMKTKKYIKKSPVKHKKLTKHIPTKEMQYDSSSSNTPTNGHRTNEQQSTSMPEKERDQVLSNDDPLRSIPNSLQLLKDDDSGSLGSCSSGQTTSTSNTSLLNNVMTTNRSKQCIRQPKITKLTKSTLCFDNVFSYYPPELTLVDGELYPAKSLSLKKVTVIPQNHPIHKWIVGRPVAKPNKRQGNSNSKNKS